MYNNYIVHTVFRLWDNAHLCVQNQNNTIEKNKNIGRGKA